MWLFNITSYYSNIFLFYNYLRYVTQLWHFNFKVVASELEKECKLAFL